MRKIFFSIPILIWISSAFAQNKPPYKAPYCIGSGVSIGATTNYQITGTIGQMVYATTIAVNNIQLAQGFNQPYAYGQPTLQATNLKVSDTTLYTAKASWTRGNGSKCLVFIKKTKSGFPSPDSLFTYTANTEFGKGTQIGTSGWYCVYNDSLTSISLTGLIPSTQYRICVLEYNGISSKEAYLKSTSTNYFDFTTPIYPPSICIVTVATKTEKNLIVWDRKSGMNIAKYNVYKFSGNAKSLIGSVAFNEVSQFIDESSAPTVKSERYCITVVDSLGRESNYSPYHQTINIFQNSQGLIFTQYTDESNQFIPEWYYVIAGDDSSNITIIDSLQSFQTIYNKALPQRYVRFGVKKNPACSPAILKAESGPYAQSLSNIVEYKVNKISSLNNEAITLFPNPASNYVTISGMSKEAVISISNLSGQIIYLSNSRSSDLTIDLTEFAKGCYLLTIQSSDRCVVKKLLVE